MDENRTRSDVPDAEIEVPDVGDSSQLPPALVALSKQRIDPRQALLDFQLGEQIAGKMVQACVRLTKAPDWVVMGEHVYLQESGAERVKGVIGFITPSRPEEQRMVVDGGFAYFFQGWAGSRRFGTVDYFVGGRSSTEKFFDKFDDDGNRLPVDELLVRKAAYTNFMNRAICGLAGLRGLTLEDLEKLGVDRNRVRAVQYQEGGKGGKGGAGMTKAPDKFGPDEARGKPWTEVSEENLVWYIKRFRESVADESKAKYKARNQSMLDAATHEYNRRVEAKEKPDGGK